MKKILFTFLVLLVIPAFQAQEKDNIEENKSTLNLKLKDGAQPDIYVDGKKFEFSIHLIDANQIAKMNVIKGKEAIEKYNSPNGVILITTKPKSNPDKASFTIEKLDGNDSNEVKTNFKIGHNAGNDPLIIIDGKEASKRELKKLSPDEIKAIEVLKDKAAMSLYKAENGVIIVKTKKNKKLDKKENAKKLEKE